MPNETPLDWIGPAKRDLLAFPEPVIDRMGYALGVALSSKPFALSLSKGCLFFDRSRNKAGLRQAQPKRVGFAFFCAKLRSKDKGQ